MINRNFYFYFLTTDYSLWLKEIIYTKRVSHRKNYSVIVFSQLLIVSD